MDKSYAATVEFTEQDNGYVTWVKPVSANAAPVMWKWYDSPLIQSAELERLGFAEKMESPTENKYVLSRIRAIPPVVTADQDNLKNYSFREWSSVTQTDHISV